jgi:N-acetylneuraminic acid mutarotase
LPTPSQTRNISAMKKFSLFFLLALSAFFLLAADNPKIPPMPVAVSGNAVASLKNGLELFSLMGVGPKRTWDDVTNKVYMLRLSSGKWSESRPVPGVGGRLGASAIGARGQVFLFGGYLVDAQGEEITVPDVNSYLPEDHRWYRGTDIPVAVDRAVIGVNQNRYIYLVGGRSKNGPINNVQVYDAEKNTWSQATPFPGAPVYGHAGGLVDDSIVFVDGTKKNPAAGTPFVASDECWLGHIDRKDPNKITWSKLPAHPGPGRVGIISGSEGNKIVFSGGAVAPHTFRGLGDDGKPVELSPLSFVYEAHGNKWDTLTEDTDDLRTDSGGILNTPVGSGTIGGMLKNQAPTARVTIVVKK